MKNNLKNLISLPFGYDSIIEMSTLVKCYYYLKNNGYNVKLVDGDSIEVEVKNFKSSSCIFIKIAESDIKYYSNLYAKSFN